MRKYRLTIGITFLLVGLLFIAIPLYADWQSTKKERALQQALSFLHNNEESMEYSKSELQFSKEELLKVLELEIPALQLKQPILPESTPENLNVALAQIKDQQIPGQGNFTVAGHRGYRDGRHFSNLDKLLIGEKIILYTNEATFVYEMTSSQVIEATYIEILEDRPEKDEITLITCTPSGLKRLAVIGELKEVVRNN